MKKLLLSIAVLAFASNAVCAMDQNQNIDLLYVAQQSITPASQLTIQKLETALTDDAFLDEVINVSRKTMKYHLPLIAQQIKGALSLEERKEMITAAREVYEWYEEITKLSRNPELMQTPAGQELLQNQLARLLDLLQKPIVAAAATRAIEIWITVQQDPRALQMISDKFTPFSLEVYAELEAELLA